MDLDINPKKSHFGSRTVKAQCNFVITVDHGSDRPNDYIYTGDLWTSAED